MSEPIPRALPDDRYLSPGILKNEYKSVKSFMIAPVKKSTFDRLEYSDSSK